MNAMVGISMKTSATEVAKLWELVLEILLKRQRLHHEANLCILYHSIIPFSMHQFAEAPALATLLHCWVCAFGSNFSFKQNRIESREQQQSIEKWCYNFFMASRYACAKWVLMRSQYEIQAEWWCFDKQINNNKSLLETLSSLSLSHLIAGSIISSQ